METLKKCYYCKELKSLTEFFKDSRRADGKGTMCKGCHKTYSKEHYKKNKAGYLKRSNSRKRKLRDIVWDLKKGPCYDCHRYYKPWQMQFDHLDSKAKIAGVSQLLTSSLELVLEEIKKCELVCANCHADRTYKRLSSSNL